MNCSGDSCGSVSGSVRGFLGVTGGAEAISILDDGLDNVAGGFGFRGGRPEKTHIVYSDSTAFLFYIFIRKGQSFRKPVV